jgi:hypothetical protein
MIIRAWILMGSWLVCVVDACSGQPLLQDAKTIIEEVNNKGASEVVRKICGTPRWERILGNIAFGDPAWIDVAIALRGGTDAGATSELHSAMFLALGTNPTYVLQKVEPQYSVSNICEGRVDFPAVNQDALAESARIRKAVEEVRGTHLQEKKQVCLIKLREGEASLKRSFGIEGE